MLIQFSEQSDWLNPLALTPGPRWLVGLTDGRQLLEPASNLYLKIVKEVKD